MPRRTRLTDQAIAKLQRTERRRTVPDPEMVGLYLRIPDRSSKAPIAFAAVARGPNGKQKWQTVGTADTIGVDQARELAREAIKTIKAGTPSGEPARLTVQAVAEQWLERRVRKDGHRTAYEAQRIVDRYIIPRIGDRPIADVRRIHVAEMLDQIEDNNGKAMANRVLTTFGSISRWLQQRDESYSPPLTRGMGRTSKSELRRKRILSDDEIQKVWNVGAKNFTGTTYADFVKLALLTAQRREKIRNIKWSDIRDGVWIIPTAPREKGTPPALKLPKLALDIINARPRFLDNPYVFAGSRSGRSSATLFSRDYKAQFDTLCGVSGWRLHDLRRTARSLMARAGVQTEIAERCLGHAPAELIQVYDHHDYQPEMAAALERLAAMIEEIVKTESHR
jgi:integrase